MYDKNIENVVALIGDNVNTKRAFARRVGPDFVGCDSHRFNLAAKDILVSYEDIVEKVHRLMKKMSFQIPAAKLRKLTHLRPKLRNDTRWSSTYVMLQRYIQVHEIIKQIELPEVQELRLCDGDHVEVERLFRLLGDLQSVTKELQFEDVGLCLACVLFDGVMEKHPQASSRLRPRSPLVENPAFERGVCKVKNGEEHALTCAERKSLQHIRVSYSSPEVEENPDCQIVICCATDQTP